MSPVRYELLTTSPEGARAGILHTRRGTVPTPTFMPVATHAHPRHLTLDDVKTTGAGIVLANTWHLLQRPGPDVFEKFGGIHPFMKWDGGVLTDSGGFQIFSLPEEREITEKGARFRSLFDNHTHLLSPETSVQTQQSIGSDIMMVLDVCIDSTSPEGPTREAMERTHRWALRSLEQRDRKSTGQALFAIVQGGVFEHLRAESAAFLTQHPFDGFAIGGLAVGESRDDLYKMAGFTSKLLPANKARYLMGVGTPIDLLECVARGCDMFDCILPTKMAQQGYAYTFEGRLRITRSEYRLSDEPLDKTCSCFACQRYSRGYLQHLSNGDHALASRLIGLHNLQHYQDLMRRLRAAIVENRFAETYRELREVLKPNLKEPVAVEGKIDGIYELVTLPNGQRAVRHRGHGEVMHPGVGPWEEARALYVEQPDLAALLQNGEQTPLKILDVGLGAAANAAAALDCFHKVQGPKRVLEIVSLEHDLAPLRLAIDDPKGFPFLVPFESAVRALLEHKRYQTEGFTWTLLHGDAQERLNDAGEGFELVFQDPFSPEKNPSMWTVEWFKAVRARCSNQARLVTYSAATPTRVSLLLGGFFVGHGRASGNRHETTFAATHPQLLPQPLAERWFIRWRRSSARGPHGSPFTPELDQAIRSHPQFQRWG